MTQVRPLRFWALFSLTVLIGACGGDGGNGGGGANPTATRTGVPPSTPSVSVPTATATLPVPTGTASVVPTVTASPMLPTPTPTGDGGKAIVSGLVVLRADVRAGGDDSLGVPPPAWGNEADAAAFDRSLSHAEWILSGPVARRGTTGEDGSFSIADLPPGDYVLEFTRALNGNLLGIRLPFRVGDDEGARIIVEIGAGSVRSTVTYLDGESMVTETIGPDGTRFVEGDGRPRELEGGGRVLVDSDGDGRFDPTACVDKLWLCGADRDCGPDGQCVCTASCPFCDDCGPPVCAPRGTPGVYRCGEDGSCESAGDRCVCASSCPDCEDCAIPVCVPSCDPVSIVGLEVAGSSQVRIGRRVGFRALAALSDGGRVDVTYTADWETSDQSVLAVDSWGVALGLAAGTASVTARFAEISSAPLAVKVVERPALRALYVQNQSCFPILGLPADPTRPSERPESIPGDILPPSCRQVVRIGASLQFSAIGEFADGSYEDLTREVDWRLDTPSVGEVVTGLFTARAEGSTALSAALGELVSEPTEIRVVAEPTVVRLSIYPEYGWILPFGGVVDVAEPGGAPDFCFDCVASLTVLAGDEVRFRASAVYDTGEWVDVTESVAWRSGDAAVAMIDAGGTMTALAAGQTPIDAALDGVTSEPVNVRVVDEATLLDLSIYQEGADRAVRSGGEALFRAHGFYDVGFGRELTAEVVWRSSDEMVGGFDEPGVFVGRTAGNVEVWAELDGMESNRLPMEVFETSEVDYCDPERVNRAVWSDGFNRVVLESDCAEYMPPAVVTLRFTVTERERPGGIFDPCLDLFVYDGARLVRTIREEGCGEPFLPPASPEFDAAAPRYQTRAVWDLKDDRGNVVPPGIYTIHGRFFLYYDPVVSIDVAVVASNGRIPCQANDCGNGCGYVHRCGDEGPPLACPTICVPLCECPAGWGITDDGDCEPCGQECCPEGERCDAGLPPCGPPLECCPAGDVCLSPLPPCEIQCCPPNAGCDPSIPPCEEKCCPPGAACTPEFPPCPSEDFCCRDGETCPDDRPPCRMF